MSEKAAESKSAKSEPGRSSKQAPMAKKKNRMNNTDVKSSEGEKTHKFFRKVLGKAGSKTAP
jgi:precorrin-6B methylase 1